MQNTSVCEVSRRLNVLRSKKKHLKIDKNIAIFKVLIVTNKKSDDENNITFFKTPIYLCFRRNKTKTKSSGSITIPGV
jgi:hypothetical protein